MPTPVPSLADEIAAKLVVRRRNEIEALKAMIEAAQEAITARQAYVAKPSFARADVIDIVDFNLCRAAEMVVDDGDFAAHRQGICDYNGWNDEGYPTDDNYDAVGERFGDAPVYDDGDWKREHAA